MWSIDGGFFTHNGLRVEAVPQSMTIKELDEVLNELDIIEAAQIKAKDLNADAEQLSLHLDYLVNQGANLEMWASVQQRIKELTADASQLNHCAKYLGNRIGH